MEPGAGETRTVLRAPETLQLRRFRVEPVEGGEAVASPGRVLVIGSDSGADLCLVEDGAVSRRHAIVEGDARGYRLRDLESKNGTWVGRLRVQSCWLTDGMVFRVGRTELRFVLEEGVVDVVFSARDRFGGLLGASRAMREVFGLLERVAPTDATVLVEGESGTGKELVAEAVHAASARAGGPLVVFDCSAVSRDLIESELFGHVRGAFTGATADRAGAFEEARGGTLFIDEIGELAPDLQPKLLRALERREVRRVGSNAVVSADVRIVAATNRSLREEVRAGRFREDLYYRLAVVAVRLPPLRERPDDIPLLVEHFLAEASRQRGGRSLTIPWETMEKLRGWRWPGNVRELRNAIERAAILTPDERIETRHLRAPGADAEPLLTPAPDGGAGDAGATDSDRLVVLVDPERPFKEAKQELVDAFERRYWQRAVARTGGNVSAAARLAGMHRKSAEYILRKLELGGESD